MIQWHSFARRLTSLSNAKKMKPSAIPSVILMERGMRTIVRKAGIDSVKLGFDIGAVGGKFESPFQKSHDTLRRGKPPPSILSVMEGV